MLHKLCLCCDWRCTSMVDRAVRYGSSRLNFVPTHYYREASSGGVLSYCYMDSSYSSCIPFTHVSTEIQHQDCPCTDRISCFRRWFCNLFCAQTLCFVLYRILYNPSNLDCLHAFATQLPSVFSLCQSFLTLTGLDLWESRKVSWLHKGNCKQWHRHRAICWMPLP
jgi:hypothetical protein